MCRLPPAGELEGEVSAARVGRDRAVERGIRYACSMHRIIALCVLACVFGCKSSSKEAGAAKGSGGGASAPTAAAATGECKTVDVCAKFPIERVAKECGGAITKVVPNHVDSGAYILDSCDYQIANGASVAAIGRTCMKGEKAAAASQMFDMQRNEKPANGVVDSDAPGVGDKAYYRTQLQYVQLWSIKGNVLVEANSSSDKDEAARKQCLLALVNELNAS